MAGVGYTLVTSGVRSLLRILCRVDDAALKSVPSKGPLIIITNHINFIDAPMLYTHLQPRSVTRCLKLQCSDSRAVPVVGGGS